MAVCTFFWLCGSIIAVFCEWTTGTWSDYNTAQARFGNALVLEPAADAGGMPRAPLLEQAVHGARADPDRAAALLAECLPLHAALVDLLPRRQVVAL
jgi:hypothetical protein